MQYPDFAALRGDPSDNLPGIPSVGEKTAAKWVREYGSLDALVDQVDTVKGKVGEKLREHLSSVLQNRRLTELDRTVALELHPTDLAVQPWDRNEVHTLFDNLQFRVLRDRLFATLSSAEPEVDGGFDVTVDDVPPASSAGGWAPTAGPGTPASSSAGAGAAAPASSPASRWPPPTTTPSSSTSAPTGHRRRAGARRLAGRPRRPKVVHEEKGPLLAVWARGWELEGEISDTALAAYLALPGQRSFDLADLSVRYLRRELTDAAPAEQQLTLDGLGPTEDDLAREAALADARKAVAVNDLSDALEQLLGQKGGDRCSPASSCR